jgi:hypothetical protein
MPVFIFSKSVRDFESNCYDQDSAHGEVAILKDFTNRP